jgi:hypothetical protein
MSPWLTAGIVSGSIIIFLMLAFGVEEPSEDTGTTVRVAAEWSYPIRLRHPK